MVPSARMNIMFDPPAPRCSQVLSSKPARSGTKLVSHMLARAHRYELAFAAEIFRRPLAFGKVVAVVEHEGFVVEEVEYEREIVGRGEPRALATARIEVLIAGVERQRE